MKWLKLTDPPMQGPEVTRLQELLQALGYDIGTDGPSGIFNKQTSDAVRSFQRKYGLIADGTVGNLETWPLFREAWEVKCGKNPDDEPEVRIVDRRGQHEPPGLYRPELSPRPWFGDHENVLRGVTLHQTGCIISEHTSAFDVGNFHIVVMRSGTIIIVNPMDWYIDHANELSKNTIAVEFEGNFPGVYGRPETVWNEGSEPQNLTDAQIKSSEFLFSWLKHRFDINGGKWEYVYAHRQANSFRPADPGSEIWRKIGLQWLKWLNGSDGGPGFKIGDGSPIPQEWNPDYSDKY